MKFIYLRNHKYKVVLIVVGCIVFGSYGVAVYQYNLNRDSEQGKVQNTEISDSPSTTAVPQKTTTKDNENTTNPSSDSPYSTDSSDDYILRESSKPIVLPKCTWKDIPYKYVFVKGTSWSLGSNGTKEICTYNNGSNTSKVVIHPKDEIVAINVTAQDKATIDSICSPYPTQYYSECARVVRYDP